MSGQNEEQFDIGSFSRLGWWGAAAIAAALAAAAAARSETGAQRAATLLSGSPASQAVKAEPEVERLSEIVRSLSADRERLQTRLTLLERNLEVVTGSIVRMGDERRAESEAALPAGPSFFATVTAPNTIAAFPANRIARGHATADGQAPAPESTGTVTAFGVDIGGGFSIEGLKELWTNAKAVHGRLLDELRPVIAVRDSRPGTAELRLVAGPLSNAAAAAKLCASISSAGWTCTTTVFDGQRLALR